MLLKSREPTEVAIELLERSCCAVQCACVIADHIGILSLGWNHVGDGFGQHAEIHALRRANPSRLHGASIYVAAKRYRNGKIVMAKPCADCAPYLRGMVVWWRDKEGLWRR